MKRSLQLSALLLLCATPFSPVCARKNFVSEREDVISQTIAQSKRSRTPAEQKIDSQLLYALYRQRGEAERRGVPPGELLVKFDEKGRAIVSIRARVTRKLLTKIKRLGGEIVSTSERYNDIRAHLPLEKLEELASRPDVVFIAPAEEAMTNPARPG